MASTDQVIGTQQLEAARNRIRGTVRITPILECPFLSERAGRTVLLKPENLQLTGSFKLRGASNHVLALSQTPGIVTASSGNHGQAVSYAARNAGLPCTVVVPEDAVENKLEAITRWGAKVVKHGLLSSERKDLAREMALDGGFSFIDSTDDLLVIGGQGTIGLEILEQVPEVETIVVPVGGGGLISGVSAAIKLNRPEVRVFGVEPEGSAAMRESLIARCRVSLDSVNTIADGLRTVKPGPLTFAHVTTFVDDILLALESDILPLVRSFATESKLVVEPSGVVAACAVARGAIPGSGPVVVVLTGGNIDSGVLVAALDGSP